MKVTLVYVGIGIAGFNPNRPAGDREGNWISHGIASIGANAKANGYEVNFIDMRKLSGFDHFKKIVMDHPSEVYGLSISPVDYYFGIYTAHLLKEINPEAKIIVGGIHSSIFPERYEKGVVDTVVVGEGEITFVDLLRMVEQGKQLPKRIQGQKPDLDSIPWIDRELFDYKKSLECSHRPLGGVLSITMLAGRGCPYHCTYCQPAENAVFGKPYRKRSPENVIAELRFLKDKYNFNHITFWDDTFTFNKKWIMDFCNLFKLQNFNAPIEIWSRADIVCKNEEMIERLADTGVDWIVIGFESGSQRILDFIRKGTTVEQNIKAGEICHKYGINIFATYMYGLPTETREESLATAKMIDKIRPEFISPFFFFPIEGTEIYKYCQENDLILENVKQRTIARTGVYLPSLKGIDYDYLKSIMLGNRGLENYGGIEDDCTGLD